MNRPTSIVRKISEHIVIDGSLTKPVWSRVAPAGDFVLASGAGLPQLPTELKMCWDDTNLYLGYVAIDTDIWGALMNRDEPIYKEEVVEAFLCSGHDIERYFEFEFSPNNTVFDARIQYLESGDRSSIELDEAWNCEGLQSAVSVVGTLHDRTDIDERWTVEVALPFVEIGRDGRPPVDGESWRANFFRIDRAGEGEFSCWSPTLTDPPRFHKPARFGTLIFSTEEV